MRGGFNVAGLPINYATVSILFILIAAGVAIVIGTGLNTD